MTIPYSLRSKYFTVLPNSAQKQILWIKSSWSSFQPRIASVMNLNFTGKKFCGHALTHEIRENFQPYIFKYLDRIICLYIPRSIRVPLTIMSTLIKSLAAVSQSMKHWSVSIMYSISHLYCCYTI